MKLLQNKLRVEAPSAEFPYGNLIDETGVNDGTAVNREFLTDIVQFFEKAVDEAGIVPNGIVDNEYDGWQLFQVFQSLISKKYTKEITTAFDGDVVTITRAEIEAAFEVVNPFYTGGIGSGTATNPFADFHIQIRFLSAGIWYDVPLTSGTGGANIATSNSTGDITITFDIAPIAPSLCRIVLIG